MVTKQKILIVDDDENIAELISLYLLKECFDTMMVHDGEEALAAFDSYAGHRRLSGLPRDSGKIRYSDHHALRKGRSL